MNRILCGDVRARLAELPDESVHCVVTSPPWYRLRDYGVVGQIGLESSLSEYIETIRAVFAEVRRVLRRDGTCWVNMGETYVAGGRGGSRGDSSTLNGGHESHNQSRMAVMTHRPEGWKPKDRMMVPARVAIALQEDGWWLRTEIIVDHPNATPESARDRPTNSHDYLYLLSRNRRYFYDATALMVPCTGTAHPRGAGRPSPKTRVPAAWQVGGGQHDDIPVGRYRNNPGFQAAVTGLVAMRNERSVWRIPAEAYRGMHFATFPQEMVRRCIVAGTSAAGVCVDCGSPLRRVTEKYYDNPGNQRLELRYRTVGWEPTCECAPSGRPVAPPVVLDPFMGSGTVALVALRTGRRYLGIDINPDYVKQAEARLRAEVPLLLEAAR